MSYTPTVWQNGDTITAQKMNKLENGVASASGVFWVHATYDSNTEQVSVTESGSEIIQAYADGKIILCKLYNGFEQLLYLTADVSNGYFEFERMYCEFSGTVVYTGISISEIKLTGEGYQEEDESWTVTWSVTYKRFDTTTQNNNVD